MNARPLANEYAAYYEKYVSRVPEGNILETLNEQITATQKVFGEISEEKSKFRYADS